MPKIKNASQFIKKIKTIEWDKLGEWETCFMMDATLQKSQSHAAHKKYGLSSGFNRMLFWSRQQFFDSREIEENKNQYVAKLWQDKDFLVKFKKVVVGLVGEVYDYGEAVAKINFDGKDRKFVAKKIAEFKNVIENVFVLSYNYIVLERAIEDVLIQELDGLAAGGSRYLNKLVIPRGRSFVFRESLGLLKIAKAAEADKSARSVFARTQDASEIVDVLKNKHKRIYGLLERHTEKYSWMGATNWVGRPYEIEHFVTRLREILSAGRVNAQEKGIWKKQREKEAEFHAVIKKLRIKGQLKKLIDLARDHLELKMWRWDNVGIAGYKSRPMLSAAAAILGLELDDIWELTFDETISALGKKRLQKDGLVSLIRERKENNYILFKEKERIGFFSGQEAKKLFKQIDPQKSGIGASKELRGMVAFGAGKITGQVRIIASFADVGKMQKGDILVTTMTDPNFMPAVVRAKAIITDQGGLLCHAAIVARELNIPCIIGTKIATQVLKDGDLVEVDAERGIVKIRIKRI